MENSNELMATKKEFEQTVAWNVFVSDMRKLGFKPKIILDPIEKENK